MQIPAIDLSGGMVPAQQPPPAPPTATIDLSAGMVPVTPPPRPQPAQDALHASLTDNPNGEGVYQLKGPGGIISVPYSKIPSAAKQSYFFANKNDLQQYARDYEADPINESAVDKYLDTAPWWDMPSHVVNLLKGAGKGAMQTFTGLDRPPTSSLEQEMQLAAKKPGKTPLEGIGDIGENIGEFFSGEELMGLIGKGLGAADRAKQVGQLATVMEKNPLVAKLLRVGVSAVKTGTISGAQTYAKTGDTGAATTSALLGGAADFGIGGLMDTGQAAIAAAKTARKGSDAAAEGAQAYSQEARNAIQPHLEAINDAVDAGAQPRAPGAQGEPGSDLMPRNALERPGAPAGATGAAAAPAATGKVIDVDRILNQVHDFTGAADRLTEVNKAGYDALEQVTGKQFRALNDQVQAAQKAVWRGQPGAEELYTSKLAEMDKLLDSTKGAVNKETVDALKASWRQSYVLRDFGKMWDKALNGVPGNTKVSAEQRGLNGKVLMQQLQAGVRRYGRFQIDRTLGPGRLDVLEQIATKTSTQAGRVSFYSGIRNVARSMERAAVLGGVAGHFAGNWAAGAAIGAGTAGAIDSTTAILDAIKTNPKIAQNFLFALDSGANAERYAPFIATLIQKANTESAQEEQQPGEGETP